MIYLDKLRTIPQENSTSWGEKMLLYWLVRELRPKLILETGTHKGATTAFLAHAVHDNGVGKIITCDVVDYQPKQYSIPPLTECVDFRICRGDEVQAESIDFAFIDGAHEAWEVESEIKHIFPLLAENATVVFHDCWPAVNKKLADVNSALSKFKTIWLPTSHGLRIYQRGEMYDKPEGWSLPGEYA